MFLEMGQRSLATQRTTALPNRLFASSVEVLYHFAGYEHVEGPVVLGTLPDQAERGYRGVENLVGWTLRIRSSTLGVAAFVAPCDRPGRAFLELGLGELYRQVVVVAFHNALEHTAPVGFQQLGAGLAGKVVHAWQLWHRSEEHTSELQSLRHL